MQNLQNIKIVTTTETLENFLLPVGEKVKIIANKQNKKLRSVGEEVSTITGRIIACDKRHFTVRMENTNLRESFLKIDVILGQVKVKTAS
jgi:hypothetical protein